VLNTDSSSFSSRDSPEERVALVDLSPAFKQGLILLLIETLMDVIVLFQVLWMPMEILASVERVEVVFWLNRRERLSLSLGLKFFRVGVERGQFLVASWLRLLLEFSIFEVALLDQFAFLPDLPFTTLCAFKPLSLVVGVIVPVHFPEAMSEIFHEGTLIEAASRPVIGALSVAFVVDVCSFVLFGSVLPHAIAKAESIFELSPVERAVVPGVGALSFWLAVGVHSLVAIAVEEEFDTLSVFVAVLDVAVVL
jgi:hypothetical protein